MKIKKVNRSLQLKRYYQITVNALTDNILQECLVSNYPLANMGISSSNPRSELNVIKAQKYKLLRSFVYARGLLRESEERITFKFDLRSLSDIVHLQDLLSLLNGTFEYHKGRLVFVYEDLLIKLRRLDFFRVQPAALTNIKITADININSSQNIIVINEIFCAKR